MNDWRFAMLRPALFILAASALASPLRAEVLASVDEAVLTWDQLVAMIGGEGNMAALGLTSPAEAEDVLMSWVREQLIVTAAHEAGLDSDPVVASYIDQAVRQILLEAYLSRLTDGITVSRLEVENYVATWKPTYLIEIHPRHILVPQADLAQSLLSRLQSGESFETLAETYSICPSAADGGDLGWLRRGDAVMEFEEAAFALSPGSMSGVVHTSMGYHIIKLLETRQITPAPTDSEIVQLVGMELTSAAQENALLGVLDSLQAAHVVNVYPERLLEHAGN